MATSVKVPKEIMELFYEAKACHSLSAAYATRWLPSLKELYYKTKAVKAEVFGYRSLYAAHACTATGQWEVSLVSGLATKIEDPNAPKKTRAPRKPKAPAVPATTAPAGKQGEVK